MSEHSNMLLTCGLKSVISVINREPTREENFCAQCVTVDMKTSLCVAGR